MGKSKISLGLFLVLWSWNCVLGQPVLNQDEARRKVISIAESQVGVRELSGKNDGKEVEKYLRAVNLGKGYAWCAAFTTWVFEESQITNPKSAWSPDWFKSNLVYRKTEKRIEPFISKGGQTFGLYYEHLKRIGHVGIIVQENKLHYVTIEGNTNGSGSRDGDGVFKKIRKKESVFFISDHIIGQILQ